MWRKLFGKGQSPKVTEHFDVTVGTKQFTCDDVEEVIHKLGQHRGIGSDNLSIEAVRTEREDITSLYLEYALEIGLIKETTHA